MSSEFITQVRNAARKRVLYLPHALQRMSAKGELITTLDVRNTIATGVVIEDYPEDVRGHSCLILGESINGRPLHVVCAPKDDYLAIITAYLPDRRKWYDDYARRRPS
ncbi:MAG: DUF4258 domain-containing protein [Spirochaetaceae bacterium]|nr:MAG: DUF4258 domain-containing protein [Spirochaetaceae bacterium]